MWPEHAQKFEKIAKDFEKDTGIHVELRVVPWDALTQTLMTGFASGDVPDVSVCWSNQMGIFHSIDEVMDLTPYLEENNGEWKEAFFPEGLELCSVNNKYYAIPFRGSFSIFAYNKTLFAKYGWHEPDSLSDFENEMEKMKEAGLIPVIAAGSPSGFRIATIADNFTDQKLLADGIIKREDYLLGHYIQVADAYSYGGAKTREWMNKEYIGKYGLAMQREEATSLFTLQKAVITLINNNELPTLESIAQEAGFELGFFAFPVPAGSEPLLSHCNFDSFMISSKTKHPNEAVEFLKYLSRTDIQQEFGNLSKSIMGNRHCNYEDPFQDQFSDIVVNSSSYVINYDYNSGNLETRINTALTDFISDPSMTPEEYGNKVEKYMHVTLNEAESDESQY
ncbi:MAG: extracellular solute-binding protein [Lachnospiraceae bacterium]|nr:extracellular solute-binding protein [Lachnospiraceae bacterium]